MTTIQIDGREYISTGTYAQPEEPFSTLINQYLKKGYSIAFVPTAEGKEVFRSVMSALQEINN